MLRLSVCVWFPAGYSLVLRLTVLCMVTSWSGLGVEVDLSLFWLSHLVAEDLHQPITSWLQLCVEIDLFQLSHLVLEGLHQLVTVLC